MCLHEFVRTVAKEFTRFDAGRFMWNLDSLKNCIWHCILICGSLCFGFLPMTLLLNKFDHPYLTGSIRRFPLTATYLFIQNSSSVSPFSNVFIHAGRIIKRSDRARIHALHATGLRCQVSRPSQGPNWSRMMLRSRRASTCAGSNANETKYLLACRTLRPCNINCRKACCL